jgi:hypothetical protein
LEEKIKAWLEKTGYPLEMSVARHLQHAGFTAVQFEYYPDPNSGQYRETDVVAYEDHKNDSIQVLLLLVFECKAAKDKPWVLFSTESRLPPSVAVQQRATSSHYTQILTKLSCDPVIQNSSLFSLPNRTGYSSVTAFNDKKDVSEDRTYASIMSVASACRGLIAKIGQATRAAQNIHMFATPFLILRGQLYEAYLGKDGNTQIVAINDGVLAWRNPVLANFSFVRVMTEEWLERTASRLKEEAKCSVSEMFVGLGSQEFALIRVRRHLGCSRGIPHCLIGVEAIEKLH